tara:strand:+ start:1063 stop:1287 length:225 start_codon:yes stop_codon:yes gene_type:complete
MAIISKLSIEVYQSKDFPKLMKSEKNGGYIVLFISNKVGTVVTHSDYNPLGTCRENWPMDIFEDYQGELTLKNE